MQNRRSPRRPVLVLALLAATLAGGCNRIKPKVPGAEQRSAARQRSETRRLQQACGSAESYDRLKVLAFDQANALRAGRTALLDRVEANVTVRMEDPVAVSRDEQLDVTVCRGHLVLDLPPGVEDAFNGERQLKTDVEYAAQAAADGSGLVYQMKGAEPIVYRLAALTLPAVTQDVPVLASAAAPAPSFLPAPSPVTTPAARPPAEVRPAVRAAPSSVPRVPAAVERPRTVEQPVEIAPQTLPVRTASPSFNGARVTSHVLQTVCADPSLAVRDRRMNSLFYAALASGDPDTKAALRRSRDRFLSFRGRCQTPACIAQAYDDRVAEIRDLASGG